MTLWSASTVAASASVNAAIDAWANWIAAVSLQLVPLGLVVLLLDRVLRRAGPSVRSALWWMIIARLVVPPALALPVGPLGAIDVTSLIGAGATSTQHAKDARPLGAARGGRGAAPNGAPHESDARAARDAGVRASDARPASERAPMAAGNGVAVATFGAVADVGAVAIARASAADSIAGTVARVRGAVADAGGLRLVFSLWLFGVMTLALLARWRYRRVRRQWLDISSPADAVILDIGRGAAHRLGLVSMPSIRIARTADTAHSARSARRACDDRGGLVAQPMVLGFISPIVVLPASMLGRTRVEVEHVLLHELAHVKRRDPIATLICLIAQILFWFHPAVWCARQRLATLREMACDRAVARVLGDETSAYRRTLILLARSASIAPAAGTIGLFQRRSALITRLELLGRPVTMRRGTERVAGVLMALGVFVSCMPRTAPPSSPTASSSPSSSATAAAAAAELRELPALDQLPGSLQKRYAVMRAMALAEAAQQDIR